MEYKEDYIKYRVDRSRQAIEDAKLSIDNDRLYNACNRIYYAIFYIVSALSAKNDFSTSKHKQLMGWFNYNFVRTGLVDQDISTIYFEAFKLRQESDYEDFVEIEKSFVEQKFTDMLAFVSEIEQIIKAN